MSRSYAERFSGAEHDLGPRPFGELAEHCYVICSTPRSGSNLLADALRSSGGLGVPMEYLDGTGAEHVLRERWGATDVAEYFAHLHARRTSGSGWFGLKLHWHQLEEFFARLDGRPWTPDRAVEMRLVVENLFPDTRWIRLRREDTVAAAVSTYRATTTGRFAVFDDDERDEARPVLDDEAVAEILDVVDLLRVSDDRWDQLVEDSGIEPYELTYGTLTADVPAAVDSIRRWLGVGPGRRPAPVTRRQADDWSARAVAVVEDALASRRA